MAEFSLAAGWIYSHVLATFPTATIDGTAGPGAGGGVVGLWFTTAGLRSFEHYTRFGASFLFPTFQSAFKTSAVAKFRFTSFNATPHAGSKPTIQLYRSNTDDHAGGAGWWNHGDNFVDSAFISTTASVVHDFNFALSDIISASGGYLSCLIVDANEYAGSLAGGESSDTGAFKLRIDFGF